MVDIDAGVRLAHVMEDCFVAAQNSDLVLQPPHIDLLLRGVDQLVAIARQDTDNATLAHLCEQLAAIERGGGSIPVSSSTKPVTPTPESGGDAHRPASDEAVTPATEGTVRVCADNLNRMVGLAGEVRIESRWLQPHAAALVHIKHRQAELIRLLDRLNDNLHAAGGDEYSKTLVAEIQSKANRNRLRLSDHLLELDEFECRMHNLGDRLHTEVLASRMRPFADVTRGFPRLVRDLARRLGKRVSLDIEGQKTRIDRDILERLEAPLNHLLRNALDHGIETPQERLQAGKAETAALKLSATHNAGLLSLHVQDDGRGVDLEGLRRRIVAKGMVSEVMAAELSENELLEFLFLPGFSTRDQVTEISGRGVGLDVVHSAVQQMRGVVRATSVPGHGTDFHLQLPVTLSVIRALLVEIGGEPYAIPLARIDRTLKLDTDRLESLENRQYFSLDEQHVGLVFAGQVLGYASGMSNSEPLPVVVLGERLQRSGLVVDRFLGERSLVVHPLDPRLGKVPDISAASLLDNGTPCLILDVDDLLRSIDILIAGGRLDRIEDKPEERIAHGKRILVVDDSITVREVERNMLGTRGYRVDVAVDGMDGWNAVRMENYDLVISDIDMPRMDGFEFVKLIKQDERLARTPVMIVSYKDREEDRQRGLQVGADYYLSKGSFHDQRLIDAVTDLIGTAE
jgi:two-component system sensor histidine kinase and response regulator WspE